MIIYNVTYNTDYQNFQIVIHYIIFQSFIGEGKQLLVSNVDPDLFETLDSDQDPEV